MMVILRADKEAVSSVEPTGKGTLTGAAGAGVLVKLLTCEPDYDAVW
jgi:hypothetical protein